MSMEVAAAIQHCAIERCSEQDSHYLVYCSYRNNWIKTIQGELKATDMHDW